MKYIKYLGLLGLLPALIWIVWSLTVPELRFAWGYLLKAAGLGIALGIGYATLLLLLSGRLND